MYDILDKVNSPADIKGLSIPQLKQLCDEIRSYMIECCSVNPGHLGSSLGAVELIVGLHYVFDTPSDKIVFDVSHQAYAHKILTGRREAFRKNRTEEGISGFTRRDESEYDAFGAGHSSTSISAALGLAAAARIKGTGEKSIALIGDGSLSGGLAFEGLNNAGDSDLDLLVVVNDNNMSIDRNIGGMHRHLLNLTTSVFYNTMKGKVWNVLGDSNLRRRLRGLVIKLKSSLVQHTGGDLFEALGFRYFGPIDGNDIESVINALQRLKGLKGPRLLHTITKKGKGYAPAEEDQTTWHAPGHFDPRTGKRISGHHDGSRYQDVFGEVLLELARKDERIVGVTPAMASGCGMNILAKEMPDRFFDVGIAEEHAVTFSAGMAAGGLKPFCNIYSSFSQRAYDQIIHDVALQRLPVVLCFDRAGLVGEDGATHHGAYDLAAYRSIPECTISVPRDEIELKSLMYTASRSGHGPFIIRYPRGWAEGKPWRDAEMKVLEEGKGERLAEGVKIAIVALGPAANRALEAVEEFRKQTGSTEGPCVWDARYLKPFDREIIQDVTGGKYDVVITVEDGATKGGLYSEIAENAASSGAGTVVIPLGIPDRFIHQGTQAGQRSECGIGKDEILQKILQNWK
ncbi:MAG: 1-deoxy-D-xylulose-5-phosphate synthase [Bacteroidales bacterium]|nr:1-deoxy-D-xylulose-5-phosphate synthase [Bacteroidales bacterium]